MPRRDPRRIVIFIRGSVGRNLYASRPPIGIVAGNQALRGCRECVSAKETNLRLQIRREAEGCRVVGNRSGNHTAIVAPAECRIRLELAELVKLVLNLARLLEGLVVVDAEDAFRYIRVKEEAAILRREEPRPRVPCREECSEPFIVG
jgi:hypothetical protein